jgi:hypothetical protein
VRGGVQEIASRATLPRPPHPIAAGGFTSVGLFLPDESVMSGTIPSLIDWLRTNPEIFSP